MKVQLLIVILLQGLGVRYAQLTHTGGHTQDVCHAKMYNLVCMVKDKLQNVNAKLQDLEDDKNQQETENHQVLQEITSEMKDLKERMDDIEETQRSIVEFNENIETHIQDLVNKYIELANKSMELANKSIDQVTPYDPPHDCSELQEVNRGGSSGVYTVYPHGSQTPVNVYCDMETDGGGWTVIQRRQDGSTDFRRNWTEYQSGFGDHLQEHWLGNDVIANITGHDRHVGYSLLITLTDFSNNQAYAEYRNFSIAGADQNYRLSSLEFVNGSAGDSLCFHNGMEFTTYDVDNDLDRHGNCAAYWRSGGFWFKACFNACLNCPYSNTEHIQHGRGIIWLTWTGMLRSLKKTEMKIRPEQFIG